MRKVGVVVLLLLLVLGAYNFLMYESRNEYDFRNVILGMSPYEVMNREKGELVDNYSFTVSRELTYKAHIESILVDIKYWFTDDKLLRIDVDFVETRKYEESYIKDFNKIEKMLTKKFRREIIEFQEIKRDESHNSVYRLTERLIVSHHLWKFADGETRHYIHITNH